MGYAEVLYEVKDRIATITLNRPDKLNAWTAVMGREVRAAMTEAAADDAVRVIVLTGAGRGFCAGADMGLLSGLSGNAVPFEDVENVLRRERAEATETAGAVPPDFRGPYAYFPTIPKPIVAALNGATAGLGLLVSLYCDLRFASDTAVFTASFARRGLIAEHGMAWMLPRLVGLQNALDLLLSARKIDAHEALRIGLVAQVLPQAALMSGVLGYARELADFVSPRSMGVIKRQLWEAQFQGLAQATAVADEEMRKSFGAEDFKEGVAHFLEKRAPRFTGR
jgi:enoyl-CoA hydratase/carnithine racemase